MTKEVGFGGGHSFQMVFGLFLPHSLSHCNAISYKLWKQRFHILVSLHTACSDGILTQTVCLETTG